VAGAIAAIGLRTYPRDVATAAASLEHTSSPAGAGDAPR
jgi:hypothetical protein